MENGQEIKMTETRREPRTQISLLSLFVTSQIGHFGFCPKTDHIEMAGRWI